MKKLKYAGLFIIFTIIFFCAVFSINAQESELELYQQYCPKPPYNIDGGTKVQKIFGINLLAQKIAESEIKKVIKSEAKGKFKVKVDSYSANDAQAGKFKRFTVNAKKIIASDIYISELQARTACGFIHLDLDKNPVRLVEPMVVDFTLQVNEEDINKTLQSPAYKNKMVTLKHKAIKISLFEFENPRVSLKNNEFNFLTDVRTLKGKPFTANVISRLKIFDNKIVVENLKFGSTNHKIGGKKMQYLVNIFDPINYMQKALSKYNCKTLLKSVKIENGKIIVTGSIYLSKS